MFCFKYNTLLCSMSCSIVCIQLIYTSYLVAFIIGIGITHHFLNNYCIISYLIDPATDEQTGDLVESDRVERKALLSPPANRVETCRKITSQKQGEISSGTNK